MLIQTQGHHHQMLSCSGHHKRILKAQARTGFPPPRPVPAGQALNCQAESSPSHLRHNRVISVSQSRAGNRHSALWLLQAKQHRVSSMNLFPCPRTASNTPWDSHAVSTVKDCEVLEDPAFPLPLFLFPFEKTRGHQYPHPQEHAAFTKTARRGEHSKKETKQGKKRQE